MRRVALTVIVVASLAAPAGAQDAPLRESALRIAASLEFQPPLSAAGGPSAGKIATALGLVGGGIAMIILGKPELTPSRFTASVVPDRVDLSAYLDPSTRTRGDDFGTYRLLRCRGRTSRAVCPAEVGALNAILLENYEAGVTDGQIFVVDILDENGFTVNSGPFVPAQYTRETLKDPQAMRLGGAALIAAGAIAALAWPDSAPVESLDVAPLPGGGWLGATVGF